ncbi:hypothetical protein KI387_015942, partial [Taxus chinensis]
MAPKKALATGMKGKKKVEDNEFLKEMKDDTLGHVERLALVKKKHEALAATQNLHKE